MILLARAQKEWIACITRLNCSFRAERFLFRNHSPVHVLAGGHMGGGNACV